MSDCNGQGNLFQNPGCSRVVVHNLRFTKHLLLHWHHKVFLESKFTWRNFI